MPRRFRQIPLKIPAEAMKTATFQRLTTLAATASLILLGSTPTVSVAQQLTPLKPAATAETGTETPVQDSDSSELLDRLSSAARKLEKSQTFDLRYKFQEGETILWSTEHAFSADVKKGKEQSHSTARSRCVMQWRVTDVDSLEQATVVLTLRTAIMWKQEDGTDPIQYDSTKSRGNAPDEYKSTDEWIDIPIATYTLDKRGRIVDRKETYRELKFGMGHVTVPIPDQPIRVGSTWHSPDTIQVRMPENYVKQIKLRLEYRLQKVEDGIAYISIDSQVLTPINDERVRTQLLQQLSKGVITFDMNRGQMLEKRLDWDEKSIGYAGPDSSLVYLAKYHTKRMTSDDETIAKSETTNRKQELQSRIRLADDGPVLRW